VCLQKPTRPDVKQIEGFWMEWYALSIAQQHSLGDVQTIWAEFVDGIWLLAHNPTPKSLQRKASENSLKFP